MVKEKLERVSHPIDEHGYKGLWSDSHSISIVTKRLEILSQPIGSIVTRKLEKLSQPLRAHTRDV